MRVQVVLALPARQQVVDLFLDPGATARSAVLAALQSGLQLEGSGLLAETAALGVFGQRVEDGVLLADGDRVELYRPLRQNPRELRRQRAAAQSGNRSGAG
jgi:putative ubiquitin-RnfH superfamily antitoxin RatB of RatAB toxin-antitoxin module